MEHEDILLLLSLPQVHWMTISNADLRQFSFTKTQLIIMTALYRRKTLNMTQVANFIASSKEQATRAVAQLVDKGYLTRSTDPANRTYVCVSLTEQGRQVMELCCGVFMKNLGQRLSERLTAEERESFHASLDSLLTLLDKIC